MGEVLLGAADLPQAVVRLVPVGGQLVDQGHLQRPGVLVLRPGALADMIRSGGDTLAEMGRSFLSGLTGQSLFDMEIARRIERLASQGAISSDEAAHMRRLLITGSHDTPHSLPSRADVDQLRQQVDTLTALVEDLLAHERRSAANGS